MNNQASKNNKPILAQDMTLRDYFAGQALQGYMASGRLEFENMVQEGEDVISTISYQFADAMMKARES